MDAILSEACLILSLGFIVITYGKFGWIYSKILNWRSQFGNLFNASRSIPLDPIQVFQLQNI